MSLCGQVHDCQPQRDRRFRLRFHTGSRGVTARWAAEGATIHVDALARKSNGYVESLAGATGATYGLLPPENATGNHVKVVQRLPVRIRFKPGQPEFERLRPGMSVESKVWLE